jgi:hypothetical protein
MVGVLPTSDSFDVTSTVRSNDSSTTISTSLMATVSPGRTTLTRLAGTPHFVHRSAHPCGPMKGTSGAQFFNTAAAKKGSM